MAEDEGANVGGVGIHLIGGRDNVIEDVVAVNCETAFRIENNERLTMRRVELINCGGSKTAPAPEKPSLTKRLKDAALDEGPKVALSLIAEAARRCITGGDS